MTTSLIIKNDDIYIGTWELSKGFDVEHRALKNLIRKYESEFADLGFIASAMQRIETKKRGGQIEEYLLTEPQATYLTTLLTNNEKVRKFKFFLTKEFWRQRKLLNEILCNQKNAEWLKKRAEGKQERRIETDAIKEFVEYATAQGSSHAKKYYMVISKMENQSLFALDFLGQKFPNLREVVNSYGLDILLMADRIVAVALKEGMKKLLPYKSIYILARDRVESFAVGIGKTPLRMILPAEKFKKLAS